jgi:putative phosphoesterase
MIIAVMSDSHDNIWRLRKALEIITAARAEMIIHCGDFVAPFMLKALEKADIPVHGVFGNNDGDKYLLTQLSLSKANKINIYGIIGRIDVNRCMIAFTHFQEIAQGLAVQGDCDLVCFGHTHTFYKQRIGETILLNPGEIMGKDGDPGFCFFDTVRRTIERISLE